jgi:beta propeller repeat protein
MLQDSAALDDTWIVWRDGRNDPSSDPTFHPANSDIFGMQLPDGDSEPLCLDPSDQMFPDIFGNLVVWEDWRNADDPHDINAFGMNVDIYMLDLETRVEQQVTSLPGPERNPRIWGHRVFFVAQDLIGQDAVFMVDLEEAGLVAPTP